MDAAVGRRGLVVVALLFLAAGMVTGIPSSSPAGAAAAQCPSPSPPPKKIMTVGDSITDGIVITQTPTAGYRAELGRLLTAACVPHTIVVAALNGSPCDHWTDRMAGLMATHRPNIVLLACGTNDPLGTRTSDQVAAWEGMYRALLTTVLAADPDVVIYPAWVQYSAGARAGGCPSWQGSSPSWQPASEAIVNDRIHGAFAPLPESGHRIAGVVDYQPIPEGYLDACGVHPTPGGYDVMGRIAYNTIAPRLGVPPVALPCGLTGHRPGGQVPNWTPCERMNLNP